MHLFGPGGRRAKHIGYSRPVPCLAAAQATREPTLARPQPGARGEYSWLSLGYTKGGGIRYSTYVVSSGVLVLGAERLVRRLAYLVSSAHASMTHPIARINIFLSTDIDVLLAFPESPDFDFLFAADLT